MGGKRKQVGDKGKIMWQIQSLVENRWETSRHKWETKVKLRGRFRVQWETGGGQVGDKGKIMRAEHPKSSGRQAETKYNHVGRGCRV